MLTNKLSSDVAPVIEHISLTIKNLGKDDINEDFAKKFQSYSNRIANLIVMPLQLKSLSTYIIALPLLCAEQMNICHSVTSNSVKLVQDFAGLTTLLSENRRSLMGKQDPEDSDDAELEADNGKLSLLVEQLIRKASWLVGYICFGLI
jgi:hypothetical protein